MPKCFDTCIAYRVLHILFILREYASYLRNFKVCQQCDQQKLKGKVQLGDEMLYYRYHLHWPYFFQKQLYWYGERKLCIYLVIFVNKRNSWKVSNQIYCFNMTALSTLNMLRMHVSYSSCEFPLTRFLWKLTRDNLHWKLTKE